MRAACSVLILMAIAYTQASPVNNQAAKKVRFGLYYESLCPGCRYVISNQLSPAVKDVGSIMDVTLVPYGNAFETYNATTQLWDYTCQHGAEECTGNLIEACAMSILKDFDKYWPFIYCIETGSEASMKTTAQQCAQKLKIDVSPILTCSTSKEGNTLMHQLALKTNALKPPHQFVPWVTLNGAHTNAIQQKAEENLVQLICDSYTGTKPPACQ